MAEIVGGQIVKVDPSGLTVHIPYDNWERYITRQYEGVRVELIDERARTLDQMRKAWAIMSDMAVYISGDRRAAKEDVYKPMCADFALKAQETLQSKLFHLSDASITEAKDFISFLLDTCLEMDIPLSQPAALLTDDIQHYVYQCTINRKCAVCGKRADLHHVDHVGMGRNRREIDHEGMRALPLCREHHGEAHNTPLAEFLDKYHLEPIVIDKRIIEKLNLGRKSNE